MANREVQLVDAFARFIVGAILGALVGTGIAFGVMVEDGLTLGLVIGGLAALCGFIAVAGGDRVLSTLWNLLTGPRW